MSTGGNVWDKVERHVVHLLGNGEAANALKELDTFLATTPPSASTCAALSYRSMTKEESETCPEHSRTCYGRER